MTANLKTRLRKLEAKHSQFDSMDDCLVKLGTGEPMHFDPNGWLAKFLDTVVQSPEYRRSIAEQEKTAH